MLDTLAEPRIHIQPSMEICQSDYPLDWYQKEFKPYAQDYLNLPDRRFETIINWMTPYIAKAHQHFGDDLLLLAHYYMGGEIVKVIEHFGGYVGDSYQLALAAQQQRDKKVIVESAVHFMAETISILANDDQNVYITNPKSGCTMEMHAKDFMVEPAITDLNERYGSDNILPICYMNTSGRIKSLTGAQGGAVCTSRNVQQIFEWALEKNKKILFIPDQNMGENVAHWCGIPTDNITYWPGGTAGANYSLLNQDAETLERFDRSQLVLFGSLCAVHDYYHPDMVRYWRDRGYNIVAHPECKYDVVSQADATGSTALIWSHVTEDRAGTKKYAIGTENHMVQNLRQQCAPMGIDVVNLGDADIGAHKGMGCGCATMSRNDPPHLVAVLDLLRQGAELDFNRVEAGDVVNEFTGQRQRLNAAEQAELKANAMLALQRMIDITTQ